MVGVIGLIGLIGLIACQVNLCLQAPCCSARSVFRRQANTVVNLVCQSCLRVVVTLVPLPSIACLKCPVVRFVGRGNKQVECLGLLRYKVACPGKVGIVGVCLQLQPAHGAPYRSYEQCTLVLHMSARTHSMGSQRLVAVAVEALYGHDAPLA